MKHELVFFTEDSRLPKHMIEQLKEDIGRYEEKLNRYEGSFPTLYEETYKEFLGFKLGVLYAGIQIVEVNENEGN